MLEKLLHQNESLKILYKPFMGARLSNDIIFKLLSKYINQGRVKISDELPTKLMPKIDIAFFDMISTGFSEAVAIGVPALVYGNARNYELASDEGKTINDELEKCGVIFYESEKGIKSFERIVNDLCGFKKSSEEPIRRYQESVAHPVNKDEFLFSLLSKIS